MLLGKKRVVPTSKAFPVPQKLVRGAADLRRPIHRGTGAAAGDFCPGGCPVDGEGRVHHKCGYPPGSNVQVFTTIVDLMTEGTTDTVSYTVTSGEFCPEFFVFPESQRRMIINDILDPNGDSLLLGPNPVIAEFFSNANDRGGRIKGCCVPAGLTITVEIQYPDTDGGQPRGPMQGSFWGGLR